MQAIHLKIVNKVYIVLSKIFSSIFKSNVSVLMFHQIGDQFSNLIITEPYFEKIIFTLKDNIIDVSKLLESNELIKKKSYIITFDDVHESFYYKAFPILLKYNIPFTLFITLSLINKKGYVSVNQINIISSSKLCTIGSHGVNHTFFRKLSHYDKEWELRESMIQLQKLFNKEVTYFAYPYGSIYACGLIRTQIIKKYYKAAFSTIPVPVSKIFANKYFIPRINVDDKFLSKQ